MSRLALAAAVAVAAAACTSNAPSSPSGSSTGSVTAPLPSTPPANASVRFADQPVTLVVQNASLTKTTGAVYTFEVATDAAFAAKVQTKDNVPEGAGGQTGVTLDALAGAKDYYWHARATGGGTTGPFSAASRFSIGASIIINPPVPISPLSGTTTPPRPTFRVTNATHVGPVGAITYLFEVSTSASFNAIVASGTKAEGVNETGFTPASDLPRNTTVYWRATAMDASNGVSSNASAAQSVTTRTFTQAELVAAQLNQVLWPGIAPTGTSGQATMGEAGFYGVGWNVQTLYYAPQNITFQSPDLEMLRFFDLFDRGYDPDSAIAWMVTHGYPTNAQWYPGPEKAVLGLHTVYLASRGKVVINGTWDIVLRVE
ncbi:MAG TPA: hypothetical protein VGY57_02580 [Vicinamibacterales bacterium]|nr:hypothetical protein [Vicinamibacterales bacterium]